MRIRRRPRPTHPATGPAAQRSRGNPGMSVPRNPTGGPHAPHRDAAVQPPGRGHHPARRGVGAVSGDTMAAALAVVGKQS